MRFSLTLPRLVFGAGAASELAGELKSLGLARPLLVSDSRLYQLGHVARVASVLTGMDHCEIFAQVPENPTFAAVDAAASHYERGRCDCVVALGGGSVVDTAKLVAVVAGQGGIAADYVGFSDRVTSHAVPIIVVPTTAGTGSDSSPDAGIHPDPHTVSSGITSHHVVPRLAICDPELTLSLPAGLTAATGFDAISHCIEGYLARTFNPLADVLALDGLKRAWTSIEKATAAPDDLEARGQMLVAAFEGGVAIGKGLGPAHAIAISCSDQGLHHGRLSGLGLLPTLALMRRKAPDRVGALGAALGLAEPLEVEQALRALMQRLGMPLTLAALGYRLGSIDELAAKCAASHFNMTALHAPDRNEYRTMLTSIAS
jgi:4-hydroxybutyrate dehydrogenase